MSDVLKAICRRLGRRPTSADDLTAEERALIDWAHLEARTRRPVERRIK